ncbi:Protein of unknown function; putative penicillin-binding protein [Bradyrhizobium sp. ORS 285]|nr:putative penicillin-binding protein [Bradyrhizobium sp. ORS 285]SMX56567.1 Protein of unknown function; putative penicillin-binding protein [Bradyrhizobium sp. ORS 285]
MHSQLVPVESRPLKFRLGDADPGDHALDQRGSRIGLIALGGKDGPKADRNKIVNTARRFGIKAPMDTQSTAIGSNDVTVLKHALAYATFSNKGNLVIPQSLLEARTGAGDLAWHGDRDGSQRYERIIRAGIALHEALPTLPCDLKHGRIGRRSDHNLLIPLKLNKEAIAAVPKQFRSAICQRRARARCSHDAVAKEDIRQPSQLTRRGQPCNAPYSDRRRSTHQWNMLETLSLCLSQHRLTKQRRQLQMT